MNSNENIVESIDELLNNKKNILNTINSYNQKIEELKKMLVDIDNKLILDCKHQWQRDYRYYGEYSQFFCSKCKLCK